MAKLGQYADQLPTMVEDEVILAVSQHLLEQKVKSVDLCDDGEKSMACVYKGDNVCCAAAIFIKDYKPEMEDNDWMGLIANFNQCGNHYETIINLQKIHDGYNPDDWLDILTVKYCNDEFPKTKAYLEIIEGEKA